MIGFVALATNGTVGLWLVKKTDIRRSSIYVYLFCAISTLGVVLINAVVPFIAANVIYFGFFAISIPLTQTIVAGQAKGKDTNLIMGCFNGVKSLGGIFGALMAGFLYTVNSKLPFILGFAAFALATVASVYYYRLSKKEEQNVTSL